MKMLASITVSVALVVVVVLSRPKKGIDQATSATHDYLDAEPFRGSEGGKMLAQACGSCHSNQTDWPWYSHVAPVSRWIQSHVRKGREELNFSKRTNYSARQRRAKLDSICGVISTDALVVHHNASWSKTHRKGQKGCVRLGGEGN